MGFDVDKFKTAKFTARTEEVPVPELAAFFGEGEEPVITVRGLDSIEFGRVLKSVDKYRLPAIKALIDSVSSGETDSIMEGVKKYLEREDKDIPVDIIKRGHLIMRGAVDPELDMQAVKKIRKVSTEVFFRLSEKVKSLTGQGAEPGE